MLQALHQFYLESSAKLLEGDLPQVKCLPLSILHQTQSLFLLVCFRWSKFLLTLTRHFEVGAEKIHTANESSPTNEVEDNNIAEATGNIGFRKFNYPTKKLLTIPSVVRTPLLELKGHTMPVVAASWTCVNSSNSVATGSWDNSVRVWSADNGRLIVHLSSSTFLTLPSIVPI